MFLIVDEEDLIFKKVIPMVEEIMGLGGGGYLRNYVRVVAEKNDEGKSKIGIVYIKGLFPFIIWCELVIPTLWSDESKNVKRSKRWKEVFEWKRSLFEIDLMFGINAFDLDKGTESSGIRMDDHVHDEIDSAKCEHVPIHVVNKGNLEVLVCKQVANHGGDELVDKGRPLKRKRVYAE
nr:hypothetical protein [Tanacetum cinerariifolium]